MTIKEFAHICECNPQTLRYYDQIDLLKPVKVDRWSGYRYYDEEQAYVFVKIKNLQKAGFTIDEIRGLLDKDNLAICRAFDEKIAKEEKRLQEIKDIRQSYQTEMNNIKNKIDAVRKKITKEMQAYNQTSEFGLHADKYEGLIDNVNRYLDNVAISNIDKFDYEEFHEGEDVEEEAEFFDMYENADYELVYEKHDWCNIKDFIDEFYNIENGKEYALLVSVNKSKKAYSMAFASTLRGLILTKNPDKTCGFTCNIEKSKDNKNHFRVFKTKG